MYHYALVCSKENIFFLVTFELFYGRIFFLLQYGIQLCDTLLLLLLIDLCVPIALVEKTDAARPVLV